MLRAPYQNYYWLDCTVVLMPRGRARSGAACAAPRFIRLASFEIRFAFFIKGCDAFHTIFSADQMVVGLNLKSEGGA